jgi:hypothetical protein
MRKFNGFIFYKELPKRLNLELQLLAPIRSFSDGVTFFEFKINFDRWKSEHTPSFQIELTILNLYNHIWVYQNNFEEEW